MIKDPQQALLNLIQEVERQAKQLPKSKERAALIKASYEARLHLPVPHIEAADAARNAEKRGSERVQELRESIRKNLTHPVSEDELDAIVARTYRPRDNVVDFPRSRREDPIARAVRTCQQLTRHEA